MKARQFEEDIINKKNTLSDHTLTVRTISIPPDHSSSRPPTHHHPLLNGPPRTHPPYATPNHAPSHNTRHVPHTGHKYTQSLASDRNRTAIVLVLVLVLRLCPGRLGIHRRAVGTLVLLWVWLRCGCLLALAFLGRGGIRRNGIGATSWSDVKCTIDMLGDGGNLRPKLLLDTVEVKAIFIRHQVDGKTQMSEST